MKPLVVEAQGNGIAEEDEVLDGRGEIGPLGLDGGRVLHFGQFDRIRINFEGRQLKLRGPALTRKGQPQCLTVLREGQGIRGPRRRQHFAKDRCRNAEYGGNRDLEPRAILGGQEVIHKSYMAHVHAPNPKAGFTDHELGLRQEVLEGLDGPAKEGGIRQLDFHDELGWDVCRVAMHSCGVFNFATRAIHEAKMYLLPNSTHVLLLPCRQ